MKPAPQKQPFLLPPVLVVVVVVHITSASWSVAFLFVSGITSLSVCFCLFITVPCLCTTFSTTISVGEVVQTIKTHILVSNAGKIQKNQVPCSSRITIQIIVTRQAT
jgi:F0F1-type ATP synthase assembly protein I